MTEARCYFDCRSFSIVGATSGINPPDGKKYFRELAVCPYCSSRLEICGVPEFWVHEARDFHPEIPNNSTSPIYEMNLARCTRPDCGWWALEQVSFYWDIPRDEVLVKWGQIKNFEVGLHELSLTRLREEIGDEPTLGRSASGAAFEQAMIRRLKAEFPGSCVRRVGEGVDDDVGIYCVAAEDSQLAFVRRARNGKVVEGPTMVRELRGLLLDQGRCRGVAISVPDTRTDQVSIWRRRKKKGDDSILVELKEYGPLLELFLRSDRQYSPWEHFFSRRG